MRKILIPVDETEHSERAVIWYINEAVNAHDFVHLVHVMDVHYSANFSLGVQAASDKLYQKQLDKQMHAETVCNRLLRKITATGVRGRFNLLQEGKPTDYLIQLIKMENIDFVVLGSRGLDTVRRFVKGSLSDHIIHHAHVPVAVIPPTPNFDGEHSEATE